MLQLLKTKKNLYCFPTAGESERGNSGSPGNNPDYINVLSVVESPNRSRVKVH